MILLVEDDMIVRVLTQTILENHHYKVIVVSQGWEAIEQYLKYQNQISVVLMDIVMATMDGISAIEKLVLINPQVKIVAISALESNRQLALETSECVKAFLLKPYTAGDLLAVIHEVMNMP